MKNLTLPLEEYQKDINDAREAGRAEVFEKDMHTILIRIKEYREHKKYPLDSYGHKQLEECIALLNSLNALRRR